MELETFGPRICILGPSNSGKSTLAQAIGSKLQCGVVYLDRLYHYPDSRWQMRPPEAFSALHEAAIGEERWVMDGNYSRLLAPRLQRATGIILLDVPVLTSLVRYFRRTMSGKRVGGLDITHDSLSWEMIHYIVRVMPAKQKMLVQQIAALERDRVLILPPRGLKKYYQQWGLQRD